MSWPCICLGTLSLMNCVFKINTFLWICCFLYSEGSNIFYRHFPRHSVVCARLSDPLIENVNTSKGSTCWKGRTCSLSNKMNKLIIIQDNWIVWYEMDAKSHKKLLSLNDNGLKVKAVTYFFPKTGNNRNRWLFWGKEGPCVGGGIWAKLANFGIGPRREGRGEKLRY